MLSHLFIAQTYGHISSPQRIDGSCIPYPYSQGFGFPDLVLLYAAHDEKPGARVRDSLVNLIAYFNGDRENQTLILGAAPLSLFRELHIHPCSLQGLKVSVELALFGVLGLLGASIAWAGGDSPVFIRLLTLRYGVWCSSSISGGG